MEERAVPTAATQNDHKRRPIWLLLAGCGIAFLLLTLLASFHRGRANIRQDAADTLALVKSTCQKYDDHHRVCRYHTRRCSPVRCRRPGSHRYHRF